MIENNMVIRHLIILLLLVFSGNNALLSEPAKNALQESLFEEEDEFLAVDDAFIISSDVLADELIVRWKIAEGYYLYKHRFSFSAKGVELGEASIPDGLKKTDEYFGEVEVYYKHIEVTIPYVNPESEVMLTLNYQGCADAGLCYTPATRYLSYKKQADGTLFLASGVATKIPGVASQSNNVVIEQNGQLSAIEQQEPLASVLEQGNLFWTLMAFLGAGLLLTFTPCVLPMVPILSGIIAGQGKDITPAKAFRLSFVYVQSMAITYAVLGILVARAGSSLSGYLQSPLILSIVAVIFVVLAFSMFGFFELKLPAFLSNRVQGISEKQRGGNYLGVAVMGVISTLIVSPCTSAPLTAALLFIAKSGNEWMGGLSLYFLGMGMGIPLLLIGVSEGRLIPRAGGWMESVKLLFGFVMLAMALYITSHLMPGPLYLLLWAILLIVASNFFGAFKSADNAPHLLRRSIAILVFLIGVIYLVGAAMGNGRLLRPLENLQSKSSETSSALKFKPFSSLNELNVILQKAQKSGQPVMVDFFAEWCVACYEFEDYTFSDSNVQQLLIAKNVLLLQADVTSNSDVDIKLMQNYNILGLPSILFFDSTGNEIVNMRATGFEDAEGFIKRLEKVF